MRAGIAAEGGLCHGAAATAIGTGVGARRGLGERVRGPTRLRARGVAVAAARRTRSRGVRVARGAWGGRAALVAGGAAVGFAHVLVTREMCILPVKASVGHKLRGAQSHRKVAGEKVWCVHIWACGRWIKFRLAIG